MGRCNWCRLNHLQVGRYAEHLVTMEFILYGFDDYSSEVDDRGIDLEYEDAREIVYGMPYADWKAKFQSEASAEKLKTYEEVRPKDE